MKKFKKVNFYLLLYLVLSCTLLIVCIAVLASFIGVLILYYQEGIFQYHKSHFIYAVKAGTGAGVPLGVGIWILAKIEEIRKRKSSSYIAEKGVKKTQGRKNEQ
ncbi:hypothetical protein [Photorhabdus viridis]|uniref:hypothetical protein n=1 Tax=Photorhabdus viridis TaxID=3163327 RepID=UPI003306AECD